MSSLSWPGRSLCTMWWTIVLCVSCTLAVPLGQIAPNDENFPEENPGLFEGDIELRPGQNPHDRNAVRNHALIWPNGRVPYTIDTAHFTSSEENTIHRAMQTIMDTTKVKGRACITFVPRTSEGGYIRYQGGSGCHTPVGHHNSMSGVTLGTGCMRIGTVMHETLHALGFWHEQSRTDRDSYVTIEWSNIQKGHEHNFDKYPQTYIDDLNEPYDYESVMHYGAYSFAIDRRKPTIQPKQHGVTIGQRTHLSPIDIKEIQILYGCIPRPGSHQTVPPPHNTTPKQGTSVGETCTFESNLCHWTNVHGSDQTDWTRYSGRTPSSLTGPNADHSGSASGHYLYIEASGHYRQTAKLLSESYAPGYYCLSLYYHMYGHNMGSLKVYIVAGTQRTLVKTYSGDHGNRWNHYLLNLHVSNGNFQVELDGTTGSSYRSDIAIDDVTVHHGQCSTLGRRETIDNFEI